MKPDGTSTGQRQMSVAIVGSGGAGVMTVGELLLATAASQGLYGLMTKSFGPQIRGGESACFLRLGAAPFDKQADHIDLLAVLDFKNIERFREELSLSPGAWIFYETTDDASRLDLFHEARHQPIGWKALLEHCNAGKGRLNILVLGLVCQILGLKKTVSLKLLGERFEDMGKEAIEANARAFQAGWHWSEQEQQSRDLGLQLPVDPSSPSRWVLTGNQGTIIGSLYAGCEFFAGYPITPATDIMEGLGRYLPLRSGVLVQAEDELAAVNMAIGASFGGKKAMTATSGPGFSLMAEGLGLALMAEIPLVVVDVQRVGPSTGIPTRTEQSDLWAALASSHGDNPRVVLAPSSVRECIELTVQAFNIAETYQVPVVFLSDQFLAGRTEILDPVPLDTMPVAARRVARELGTHAYWRFGATEETVAPMALPGAPGGEYTAESLEHDAHGWPDITQHMHQAQAERRIKKLDALAAEDGWVEVCGDAAAKVGIIGWGSTGGVVRDAVRVAQAEGYSVKGLILHLLFPPQPKVVDRLFEELDLLYVAELSSLKQFYHYLRACYRVPSRLASIARAGGMPFRTSEVLEAIGGRGEA